MLNVERVRVCFFGFIMFVGVVISELVSTAHVQLCRQYCVSLFADGRLHLGKRAERNTQVESGDAISEF